MGTRKFSPVPRMRWWIDVVDATLILYAYDTGLRNGFCHLMQQIQWLLYVDSYDRAAQIVFPRAAW